MHCFARLFIARLFVISLVACAEGPPGHRDASEPKPAAARADPRPPTEAPITVTATVARYTWSFSRPEAHFVDVEAVFPVRGREYVVVMMPVWTPGSYLIREYARHVEGLRALAPSGDRRPIERVAKNRYRIAVRGDPAIALRYRVYGREPTVRTNFIDADHAVLSPAAVVFADVDHLDEPMQLTVVPPAAWPDVAIALPRLPTATSSHAFVAEDFDALVDAPLVAGRLDRRTFSIRGVPHEVVTFGGGDVWDHERAAHDAEAITAATVELWGGILPYERYLFLNVLNGRGGGLEHKGSTLMMADPWAARDEDRYLRWTGLVTHELFHAWNGKRLRPKALGPFDYERENYTRMLWAVEGFTSYYDNLLRVRAGILSAKSYLEALSRDIEKMAATPGRDVQSLDDASYFAWIKFYRPDENARNTTVSYYTKGSLLGWILDARIRRASNDTRSLDDVMRAAYTRFSGDTGYSRDDLLAVVRKIGGPEPAAWLDEAARTARPLDYGPALEWFGLRFTPVEPLPAGDDANSRQTRRKAAWLGIEATQENGRLMVTEVVRGGPAFAAGINVDDELIGLDGHRILDLSDSVRRYEPGSRLELLVARRGKLRPVPIEIGVRPRSSWSLEFDPAGPASVGARRQRWLAAPTPK